MRVVFDANILVAAFVTEGICARLLKSARQGQFLLFPCPFVLHEFERVLSGKLSAAKGEVVEAVEIIREAVHETITPTERVQGVSRDPDDDNILACARAAEADYLVTGDSDLLGLKEFRGIIISTPRDFEALFAH